MTPVIATAQDRFAAALRVFGPAPDGLAAPASGTRERRFAVYRNNVAVALIGAVEERFPATARLAGADAFRAIARAFIRARPPRSPLMMRYGDDLPEFLDGCEGLAPALPDVARLEAARTRAYHAADAEPLAPAAFARIAPADAFGLRLTPHPSLEFVPSRFPIVSLWEGADDEAHRQANGETALIARPRFDVETRRAPKGADVFVARMKLGDSVGEAYACTAAAASGFDLAQTLATLIGGGLVTALTIAAEPSGDLS